MTDEYVERERVRRFEWERLMLRSPMPQSTRLFLLVLGVYMSEDGGNARPGIENLMEASGYSRRPVIRHLGTAIEAGYLDQVVRGGWRGTNKSGRASVYVATVPKDVFERAASILGSPPWKRRRDSEGVTHDTFATAGHASEGAPTDTFATESTRAKVSVAVAKVSSDAREGVVGDTPPRTEHHVLETSRSSLASLASDAERGPSGARHPLTGPHPYEPGDPGVCRCGRPELNIKHRTEGGTT